MSEVVKLPEGATLKPDGTVAYTLQWPIKYKVGAEERAVTEVAVRRKNLDDNLAIKDLETSADVAWVLIQRLCDVDHFVAGKIDDVDNAAIGVIIESFTKPGRRTGSKLQG